MFDQTTILAKSNTTNISNYNSVGGTLVKSTQGSKIIRFHMESELAKSFFNIQCPHYTKKVIKSFSHTSGTYEDNVKMEIEVLQVMLCGGDNYLVEYIEL